MIKVKICGIRREEDIKIVNRYRPDYIGFVFADSRRRVTPERAAELAGVLDNRIMKAGIFVNEDLENVIHTLEICSLDVLQMHGDESMEYIKRLRSNLEKRKKTVDIWKAVRIRDKESIKSMGNFYVEAFILDTYSENSYGGAGKAFDWNLAIEAKQYGNIVLAGGLNTQNVEEAIEIVRPFAIDVSSGVESNGWKDESRVRDFIQKVRDRGGYS